ncbi:MAG: DUF2690 domain-containing protein [Caldilineae bacterium]|nr:MAG: DUF2690 domain-containing protein [Caldilineae bacterium]
MSAATRRLYSSRKVLLHVLLIVAVVVLAGLPVQAEAGRYPTCHGRSCRGKSPVRTGCNRDAVTIDIVPKPGTASAGYYQYVELKYSPTCDASWARVVSRLDKKDILFTRAVIKGHKWRTRVKRYGRRVVKSRMWSGLNTACGVSVWKDDPTYRVSACVEPPAP